MSKIKVYVRALRTYSFTITVVQIILGTFIALWEIRGLKFNVLNFILALLGAIIVHGAANVLSDYYDYKKKVDREGTYGSSGVLVEKLLTLKEAFTYAIFLFFLSFLIALYFVFTSPNSFVLILIILTGALFGIFYTAGPVAFKYKALGDIAVFIAFGPIMTLGAYFVQAYKFSWTPIIFSIPLALLVDAVLHGNNLRDIDNDKKVNIKTIPIILGEERAKRIYYFLIVSAYIVQFLLIILTHLPYYTLLTIFSIPLGFKLIEMVKKKDRIDSKEFALIDMYTSKFHLTFGFLFIFGLLISFLVQ